MKQKGMPIYFDDKDRRLIDALSLDDQSGELYPSSIAAQKLHRCLEAMRDLLPLIEDIAAAKATDKRKRGLKLLFTPLYSFVEALRHLMHDIQTNPDTKRGLPPGTDALVSEMEKLLDECVPHQRNQLLRQIRNQLSSHIDAKLDPIAARNLFAKVTPAEVGKWLDCMITVLADLMKLPIYIWSCSTARPNVFGLTAIGAPFITFFETVGRSPTRIIGIFLMKRDPRTEMFELLQALVTASRWMFNPTDPQIRGFKEDAATESWAQSLISLQEMKKLPTTEASASRASGRAHVHSPRDVE